MKTPIIPIERASEELVKALIASGILVITENGIKTTEKQDPAPTKARDPKNNTDNAICVYFTTRKGKMQ